MKFEISPDEAIRRAGGPMELAKMFHPPISRQVIEHWVRNQRIPAARLVKLFAMKPTWFRGK